MAGPLFQKDQKMDITKLRDYIERIERLEEEKKDVQNDIKEVYLEAKAQGFNKKALKAVIKLRKMNSADRDEYSNTLDDYMNALGQKMYGYRIHLYAVDNPIRTANESNKIRLLSPWNNKYLELIGFIKNQKPVSIYQLENLEDFNIFKGSSPVFILLNGNPKTLKYKVNYVERIVL